MMFMFSAEKSEVVFVRLLALFDAFRAHVGVSEDGHILTENNWIRESESSLGLVVFTLQINNHHCTFGEFISDVQV